MWPAYCHECCVAFLSLHNKILRQPHWWEADCHREGDLNVVLSPAVILWPFLIGRCRNLGRAEGADWLLTQWFACHPAGTGDRRRLLSGFSSAVRGAWCWAASHRQALFWKALVSTAQVQQQPDTECQINNQDPKDTLIFSQLHTVLSKNGYLEMTGWCSSEFGENI